jgi:hypothetical protein
VAMEGVARAGMADLQGQAAHDVLYLRCWVPAAPTWTGDGPVTEVGHEVPSPAEGFDVAGDDLEGCGRAGFDLEHAAGRRHA